jgi:integrase/recombinase XerD
MKKLTLKEVYDEFLAERVAKNLTPETLFHYERAYKLLDVYMRESGIKYFTRLTSVGWTGFMRYLNNGRRKPVTVNTYLRGARAIVLFAKAAHGAPDFAPLLTSETESVKEVYSDAQLVALLKEPKSRSFAEMRGWTLTNFLLYSCLREKSLINIRVDDLDFEAGEMTVRQLKNKKVVVLPLTSEIIRVLKKYLVAREAYLHRHDAVENGYLFINRAGAKMTRFQIYSAQRCYNKRRGVDKKGVHIFRNTFAKIMIRNGCDAFTLQRWMCHADLESTKRYVVLFSRDLFVTVRKYNPLITLVGSDEL